ncbi:hypothetical protein AB0395_42190 [Streptosporangium sp. NPDC051023]|uniref:hypothetical protein n=1 Tax=Streptosporangium sp. NPDC051023 TaxID=3155410 RepID=UPI00344FF3BA
MHDGKSSSTNAPAIPGWRLILSDQNRFWAFRQKPFPLEARRAGAEPAVDADTFDELQAEIARQEKIAEQAAEQAAS